MSIDRCDICKECIFSFEGEHKCKPKWECRIGDEDFDRAKDEYFIERYWVGTSIDRLLGHLEEMKMRIYLHNIGLIE